MSALTHVARIKLEANDGIVLLQGETPTGDAVYAYVRADAEDIEHMISACEAGVPVDYSKYKEIIKHDWGDEPSNNVKIFMEDNYGFHHGQFSNVTYP